jgi:hypothetical protein
MLRVPSCKAPNLTPHRLRMALTAHGGARISFPEGGDGAVSNTERAGQPSSSAAARRPRDLPSAPHTNNTTASDAMNQDSLYLQKSLATAALPRRRLADHTPALLPRSAPFVPKNSACCAPQIVSPRVSRMSAWQTRGQPRGSARTAPPAASAKEGGGRAKFTTG